MFNRRISRPINPAVLEKNDITTLQNLGTKTAEQRIVLRHEGYIKDLRNKLHETEQKCRNQKKNINLKMIKSKH